MANQRKRIGPLNSAGSVATENAKVYKELRRGRIDPSLASRHWGDPHQSESRSWRSWDAQKRIEQLEELLTKAGHGKVIPLKAVQWLAT